MWYRLALNWQNFNPFITVPLEIAKFPRLAADECVSCRFLTQICGSRLHLVELGSPPQKKDPLIYAAVNLCRPNAANRTFAQPRMYGKEQGPRHPKWNGSEWKKQRVMLVTPRVPRSSSENRIRGKKFKCLWEYWIHDKVF